VIDSFVVEYPSSSYVYRGDRERRRRRARRLLQAAGLTTTIVILARDPSTTVAAAAPAHKPLAALVRGRSLVAPPAPLAERAPADAPNGPGSTQQLRRWHRVYRLAGHYGVAPDLAAAIHDIALAEGIEPDLGFRLVRAESEFNEHATSPVGAVGLTQVMPGTARHYVRGVSRRHLYDRRLNLHVGFRYLRGLIREYKSLRLALLVYNRGPVAVDAALKRGDDPANGYEEVVAKGYEGRGVVR
jgi:soluble lytic murein transglycosylase-like protein